MDIVDEYTEYNDFKREEFKLEYENGENVYRKINKKELDKFLDKKLLELEISEELQNIIEDDFLVSSDLNSLYPGAQMVLNKFWPKIETAYPFEKTIE